MPKVFVTQIPHKKDAVTGAYVPSMNISPASEHGEMIIMMPPRASFFATADLVKQLKIHLKDYDYEAGDAVVVLGDPIITATVCAILGAKGSFTILRWDRNLGRYTPVRILSCKLQLIGGNLTITLDAMTGLARALMDADSGVDQAELALTIAKEKARILREETIPGAMQELGLKNLTLSTGQHLKLVQEVYASIPAANKPAAYKWLNDNNFGGLIKVNVVTSFGKGERDNALEFCHELQEEGKEAAFEEGIHSQTLKAFLKEQLAAGTKIPLDLFGARPVLTAKLSNKA
jgi:hypothetical protein